MRSIARATQIHGDATAAAGRIDIAAADGQQREIDYRQTDGPTDGQRDPEPLDGGPGGDGQTSGQATPGRPRRAQTSAPHTYDETTRRGTRKRTGAYMMRGDGRGAKRLAIELGVRTLDRIVNGTYEWRDAGLRVTPKE